MTLHSLFLNYLDTERGHSSRGLDYRGEELIRLLTVVSEFMVAVMIIVVRI